MGLLLVGTIVPTSMLVGTVCLFVSALPAAILVILPPFFFLVIDLLNEQSKFFARRNRASGLAAKKSGNFKNLYLLALQILKKIISLELLDLHTSLFARTYLQTVRNFWYQTRPDPIEITDLAAILI